MYNGCVAIRVKGKMVRVKTPMCPALRRLNKLDDKDEDLKLPFRVLVELRPKDMSAFLRVQNMALNPRIRTVLPLQKRLSTLLTCVSKKWKAAEIEYLKNMFPLEEIANPDNPEEQQIDLDAFLVTPQLKFIPPKDIKVNLPEANINEYLARESICLRAFEERMGIEKSLLDKKEHKKTPKSHLNELLNKSPVKAANEVSDVEEQIANHLKSESVVNMSSSNNNTSGCTECPKLEHMSEEGKLKIEKTQDQLVDEALDNFFKIIGTDNEIIDELSSTNKGDSLDDISTQGVSKPCKIKKENGCLDMLHAQDMPRTEEILDNNKINKNISSEEQLTKLYKILNGWTVDDCDTLTIGELYLMFGSASKVVLEYYWVEKNNEINDPYFALAEETTSQNDTISSLKKSFGFTEALRKLVSMVRLHQENNPSKCPCGHVCSPKNSMPKKNHNKSIGDTEEKVIFDESLVEVESSNSICNSEDHKQKSKQFEDFIRPHPNPPPVHLMAQLDSIEKLKPKYSVRKGRRLRTKQLVVERELPLMPKASNAHQILRMNIISENSSNNGPISAQGDHCEVDTQTSEGEIISFTEQASSIHEKCTVEVEEVEGKSNVVLTPKVDIPIGIPDQAPSSSGSTNNLSEFLQDSSRSLSPSGILKENPTQWITSEVGDFSLSSFLGHLESPMKSQDDVSHDVDAQVRSMLSENSFDYTAKFADLAFRVASDTAN